jgi:hypothetical protein
LTDVKTLRGKINSLRRGLRFPAQEKKSVAQEILLPCAGNPAPKFKEDNDPANAQN